MIPETLFIHRPGPQVARSSITHVVLTWKEIVSFESRKDEPIMTPSTPTPVVELEDSSAEDPDHQPHESPTLRTVDPRHQLLVTHAVAGYPWTSSPKYERKT